MSTPNQLFEELKTLQAQQRLPPIHQWQPDRTGTIDIRIAADGTWYHEGAAFERLSLVKLFSTILRKDDDGYFLVTPQERLAIVVEDVPFVAVGLEASGVGDEQVLGLRTQTDDVVFAGPDHPPGSSRIRPMTWSFSVVSKRFAQRNQKITRDR